MVRFWQSLFFTNLHCTEAMKNIFDSTSSKEHLFSNHTKNDPQSKFINTNFYEKKINFVWTISIFDLFLRGKWNLVLFIVSVILLHIQLD